MAAQATTPPPLQATSHKPTAKERKYDRQLRLWAANGQKALEEARILLLNSGSGVTGVETLKNLILPGIGSFTIVDEADVEESDLGVNFFLQQDSLGKSRAEESCALLRELNPEVKGEGIQTSIEEYMSKKANLDPFSLIILIGPSNAVSKVSEYCEEKAIPLVYVHSVGFYSHFSVQLPSKFPIVETHPDPASTQDLRLLQPWPELAAYAKTKTKNIDKMSDHDHGHVPYLFVLLHYLEVWRDSHDGKPPQNYSEKKEFTTLVQQGARTSTAEGPEENFEEGAAAVLKSLNEPRISSGVRSVFDSNACITPEFDTANFWVVAHAIRTFYDEHHVLPLPGSVPDMKAQSSDYIELQNIYKAKARKDVYEVTSTIRAIEKALQREQPVEDSEIEAFCKGAAFVKLIHGRPLQFAVQASSTQLINWSDTAADLAFHLQMPPEDTTLPVLVAFLALDAARPSTQTDTQSHTIKIATELITSLARSAGILDTDTSEDLSPIQPLLNKTHNILAEFERADDGKAELHNIAALTGGLVAQEIIKIVTKQYVPVDNACVFDGVESKTGVFRI